MRSHTTAILFSFDVISAAATSHGELRCDRGFSVQNPSVLHDNDDNVIVKSFWIAC